MIIKKDKPEVMKARADGLSEAVSILLELWPVAETRPEHLNRILATIKEKSEYLAHEAEVTG